MLSGGECGIWSITIMMGGAVWLFLACACLDLCCCGFHAHADQGAIQSCCRVELCCRQCTEFLVFFLARKLNGLAS
jgi:hypothetical protein